MCHYGTPNLDQDLDLFHRVKPLATATPFLLTDPRNSVKNRLAAFKKDRGDFVNASHVNSLYQGVIEQGPLSHLILRISR